MTLGLHFAHATKVLKTTKLSKWSQIQQNQRKGNAREDAVER